MDSHVPFVHRPVDGAKEASLNSYEFKILEMQPDIGLQPTVISSVFVISI